VSDSRLLPALTALILAAGPLPAADLAKIDRTIAKEPAYKAKPRYCLLVFGPEAKTRVWLVLDGDNLYVDKNGNGDLTEPGEKVAARKDGSDPEEGVFTFDAGAIRDGKLTHRNLGVAVWKLDTLARVNEQAKQLFAKDPKVRRHSLSIELEMPGHKGAGAGGRVLHYVDHDVNGPLQFAERPQDAPIIHLGGPWQVTFAERPRLAAGREAEVNLVVGAPGLGAGTTAIVGYENLIPENVYPTAEITYPPGREGERPLRELYEIKGRC
jgi:hypothetical protein